MSEYRLVLGLEIHMHLKTKTKMFCGCDANIYDAFPNTHTCPTCLGLPGALPVPNRDAVFKTQLLGLSLGCKINEYSRFDRKHYFYPDLPKGFQISQYKQPLCEGTDNVLERIHLEEDTAKSFHEGSKTMIDFNKSGMPLIEIVTKPTFESVEHAVEFCRKIRDLAKFLGVSDADMEKGQMRIEPNISLRTSDMEEKNQFPEYKVEVKNINSFRFMEKAVKYEIERQRIALESGETLIQENRGYDEARNITVAQRTKEEAHDYRYFPEPDIPPMYFDDLYIKSLSDSLPELPDAIKERLLNDYNLSQNNAEMLTSGSGLDLLPEFEALIDDFEANKVANLLLNRVEYRGLTVDEFKEKLEMEEDKITDNSLLDHMVDEVIAENPNPVQSYKEGKESVLQFLIGQVMRKSRGKADPETTKSILTAKLAK